MAETTHVQVLEPDDAGDGAADRARVFWSRLGGKLGVGMCAVGLLLVFLGWNGAAGSDRVPSQFPYLISGGIAGLCFVVIGVGLIVVQNQRADRAALQQTLQQLQAALDDRNGDRSPERPLTATRPAPRRSPGRPS